MTRVLNKHRKLNQKLEGFDKGEYEPNEDCREFDEADDEAQCEKIREVLGEGIPQEVRVLPVIDSMPVMQLV